MLTHYDRVKGDGHTHENKFIILLLWSGLKLLNHYRRNNLPNLITILKNKPSLQVLLMWWQIYFSVSKSNLKG